MELVLYQMVSSYHFVMQLEDRVPAGENTRTYMCLSGTDHD